jgi:hypothetical protein
MSAKEAVSHEQEIAERVKRETAERLAKPPIPAGSIVLIEMSASRETRGEVLRVPAMVLDQDENRDLTLSAFHLNGLHRVAGVNPKDVEIVYTPGQTEEIFARLSALETPPKKGRQE